MRRALLLEGDRLSDRGVKISHGSHARADECREHAHRPDLAFSISPGDVNHAADDLNGGYDVDENLAHTDSAALERGSGCGLAHESSQSNIHWLGWDNVTVCNGGLTL